MRGWLAKIGSRARRGWHHGGERPGPADSDLADQNLAAAADQPADPNPEQDLVTVEGTEDTLSATARTLVSGARPASDSCNGPPVDDWDRYKVLYPLGRGGMGQVFKAFDPSLKRYVALKFLLAENPETARRFMREAHAQALVQHQNVCRIYEVGEVNGKPYIAMQYIEGRSLIQSAAKLNLEQKLTIVAEVADGLHAAHRHGLIHRDLNPTNVVLEQRPDGSFHPYVLDFGIALQTGGDVLTTVGGILGTPAYMAPEQLKDDSGLDRRSDVYGLGATLYRLCTGQVPFQGKTPVEVAQQTLSSTAVPPRLINPEIPADIERIVTKCLAKQPQQRYDTAAALAADLRRYLAGLPVEARRGSFVFRLARTIRRHRLLSAVVGVAAVLATSAVGCGAWALIAAQKQAAAAHRLGQEVREIEAIMRVAEMSPLHDTSAERQLVRDRMEAIKSLGESGQAESGLTLYALGRGALALADPATAEGYFRQALEVGYRSPEVFHGLGLALTRLYERALVDGEQMVHTETQKAWLATRLALLDQALGNLLRGQHGSRAEATMEIARVAFLEERWDDACEAADRARALQPGLAETLLLEGRVLHSRGERERQQANYPQASKSYARAESSYQSAIDFARSSLAGYLGRCHLWYSMAAMAHATGGDFDRGIRNATEACSQARLVDPNSVNALIALANANLLQGEHEQASGGDPTAAISEALRLAATARDLDPERPQVMACLGRSFQRLARHAIATGSDPGTHLDQAIEVLVEAVSGDPGRSQSWLSLGLGHSDRGELLRRSGENPKSEWNRALECFRQASESSPGWADPHRHSAAVLSQLGNHAQDIGEDPTELYTRAAEQAEQAMASDPSSVWAQVNLASIMASLGAYQLDHGVDPTSALTRSLALCQQAVVPENPQLAAVHLIRARSLGSLAAYQQRRGEDPAANFSAARLAFEAAIATNPNDAHTFIHLGTLNVDEAEYLLSRGQPPRSAINRAVAAFRRSIELDPSQPGAYKYLGRAWTVAARWDLGRDRNPGSFLDSAEAASTKAHHINPNDAAIMADIAQLRILAGARAKAQNQSPEKHLAEAAELLAQALAIDPDQASAHRHLGTVEGLRAGWLRKQGRSPEAACAASLQHLDRAAEIDRFVPATALAEAQTMLEQVRWRLASGGEIAEAVARAGQALAGLLETNPGAAEAHALQACFAVIQAQTVADPDRRERWNEQARESRQLAFDRNPLLKPGCAGSH